MHETVVYYSYCEASIGVRRAALTAGHMPATGTTTVQKSKPMPNSCGGHGVGPNLPVYCVLWNEIAGQHGFVSKLNDDLAASGQLGAGLIRLPSEAEWERAARAGNQWRLSHGDVLECDDSCGSCVVHYEHMWWCGNDSDAVETVSSKQANAFGFSDMHGNVWEWVSDWYTDHLGTAPDTDPTG
jgi:formylglycine-generating enzyme required for sulfatase activity